MAAVIEEASDFLYNTGNVIYAFQLDVASQVLGLRTDKSFAPSAKPMEARADMILDAKPPVPIVYGRARRGSYVAAILTSGERSQFKHLVCIHAGHECTDIEEVWIAGKPLGTLDGSGFPTTGEYTKQEEKSTKEEFTGTGITLAETPKTLRVLKLSYNVRGAQVWTEVYGYTLVGATISGLASATYRAVYTYDDTVYAYVRVLKHLGSTSQVADATTIAEVPTKWNSTKTLSGLCYTIVRLDLDFQPFQGGIPKVEVLLKGKKLHDVRDGAFPNDTPVWSNNVALIIADYLMMEGVCDVPWTDLPLDDFIAAANVCDETITIDGASAARYTADGVVFTDEDQKVVLDKLAKQMAGTLCGTTWNVKAGKYTAPVMSLSSDDIVGSLAYAAGASESDLFNGVKGRAILIANNYGVTDFRPFSNPTYVTADGQELWKDMDFDFQSNTQRIHNLCRIYTEDMRNTFILKADFSYKAWDLRVGDRVSFTSALLGQTNKVYRVLENNSSPSSPVSLVLKEDAAGIWDLADAVVADATPNTGLPSPFTVAVPINLTAVESLYETSGSAGVKVKATVTWDAPNDGNIQEYELAWKPIYEGEYAQSLFSISKTADVTDLKDGKYDFKVRARNHLGLFSAWSGVLTKELFGLTTAPAAVQNFTVLSMAGMARCNWDVTADLDVKIGGWVEIRYATATVGAAWENAITLPEGVVVGDATQAIVPLATGTYFCKFIDSSGNYSETAASFVATEALVTGWTTVATSTQHPTFSGVKTSMVAVSNVLKLDGTMLVDSATDLVDTWGLIDSLGGVALAGSYEFAATMDCGSVASRRFHATITALTYSTDTYIDARVELIDAWGLIDGEAINDVEVVLYISISDDNVTYSAWIPFVVGDFRCRYAKFKLVVVSGSTTHNVDISALSVVAKI